ncbi:MAG: substrate-binding domain-containing protein [Agathobacter sp.]
MKKRRQRRKRTICLWIPMVLVVCLCGFCLTGCGQLGAKQTIRILSGSENKELEDILHQCSKKTGVNIDITYKGSVDIMRELEAGAAEYDAVWPASSLWISMGDSNHLVKQAQSVSTTPVVFGIKQSLAEKLGFVGKEVSVKDLLSAIQEKKMTFCMTSATQSNSGASAYIGFLYALMDKQDSMTTEDLKDETLKKEITGLLSGIDRSSGSSDWLKDMFLKGDYDAMVNYEALIISANQTLEQEGREPLYVVYPYDGLSIADSPFGYVDHGDEKKQEAFTKVQNYLLSDPVQTEIQKTGRRTGYSGVAEENRKVFKKEWGIDTERILSPITMPDAKVLEEALNLYQTQFKKPSLNVYCLDFSGSMEGEGNEELVQAMSQLLIQENAKKNYLQATEGEVNIVLTFSNEILDVYTVEESTEENLQTLYDEIAAENCMGGTDIYLAAQTALELISESYDLSQYTPAIILMTDGKSNGDMTYQDFEEGYRQAGADVPVFSILFGDAEETQLKELAELTNARIFDGTKNLTEAFRSVKGYN